MTESKTESMIEALKSAMIEYDAGDPARIQHFLKVHSFARLIGVRERLEPRTLLTLEVAAVVHDIGIKAAEAKYGSSAGPLQEKEGAPLAEEMTRSLWFAPDVVERVAYLVGRHHTYADVDGDDYRILLEADALVNLFEHKSETSSIRESYGKVFRTDSGREICRVMFGLDG